MLNRLHKFVALFAILLGSTSANAGAVFTWDVSAIGLGGSAFTADALKATEVSHITFTDMLGNWSEHGYIKVTGVLNNGVLSVPTNLNSSYTLYFDFNATGNAGTGQIFTATETLYAVNGVSTFGIDGNNDAFVNHGVNTPTALATSTLIVGSIGQTGGGDLFANLLTTFAPTPSGNAFFQSPNPFPGLLYGAFYHSASEPGGIVTVPDGYVLNGGDDTLYFIPEPQLLALFAIGLPGLGLLFGRRNGILTKS